MLFSRVPNSDDSSIRFKSIDESYKVYIWFFESKVLSIYFKYNSIGGKMHGRYVYYRNNKLDRSIFVFKTYSQGVYYGNTLVAIISYTLNKK